MRTRRVLYAVTAGAVCLLAAGCAPPKTTVTGKVTYQGRPVTWGAITLVSADGIAHPGALQADGTFTIPGVPVGPVRIGVRSQNPAGKTASSTVRRGGPADPAARKAYGPAPVPKPSSLEWFPIPGRYADPDQSGLTADVRAGEPLAVELH